MPSQHVHELQQPAVRKQYLRLNARAWGMAFGIIFGLGLFAATLFLVARGGDHVGAHLGLLGVYFPGYQPSVAGAFIGFVYAFVVGYLGGRVIGSIYNFVADRLS